MGGVHLREGGVTNGIFASPMCHCGPYDGEDSFFNGTYYVSRCEDDKNDDDDNDVDDDELALLSSLVSNLCSNVSLNFSQGVQLRLDRH